MISGIPKFRRLRVKKHRILPLIAVPLNVKPDARVEMLKTIEPKRLETPISANVQLSSLVMMTGRIR